MSRWAPIVAAACIFALGSPTAFAQQQDSTTDILKRAQQQNEKRAVEELIDKLKGPTPTPGAVAPSAPPTAPPSTATPAVPTPSAPAQPQVAAPVPPAAPTVSPGATPTSVPATPPPIAVSPPVQPPPSIAQPVPPVSPASVPPPATAAKSGPEPQPPSVKAVITPPMDVSRAPEMADKLKLPSAEIEIYFEFNSAEIMPDARVALDTLGAAFADPRLAGQRFVIAGHTDAKGRADYNLALSQRRAEAVRKYVVDNFKISPNNLIARGFGRQQLKNRGNPLADENRRVQIINWTSQSIAQPSR